MMNDETSIGCAEFRDLVTDYLEEALQPAEAGAVGRHRQDCESCEDFLGQIQLTVEALGALNQQRTAHVLPPRILDAFREWRDSAARELVVATETIEGFLELCDFDLKGAASDLSARNLRLLGQIAIDEAVRMGVVEPRDAVRFARVGVALFQRAIEIEDVEVKDANERLAEAWAVLGNARRICSDFRGAEEAFRLAGIHLSRGSGGTIHRANVLQLRAVFLAECGELSEALQCIDEAITTYQSIGDSHLVGRALIGKGTLTRPFGEPAVSVENLQAGLDLVDENREPRLVLVAKHNLVHSLIESGSRDEALRVLSEARDCHSRLDNPVDLIRFNWLEGKIALDLGDLGAAEELFLQVKEFFVRNEMAHDVAVVSLDLAMVYLKQGRTVELKKLAGEMVAIFGGLGVRRELFAALAFFKKAKEIEQTATVGILQELIEALEQARQRGASRPQLSMSN